MKCHFVHLKKQQQRLDAPEHGFNLKLLSESSKRIIWGFQFKLYNACTVRKYKSPNLFLKIAIKKINPVPSLPPPRFPGPEFNNPFAGWCFLKTKCWEKTSHRTRTEVKFTRICQFLFLPQVTARMVVPQLNASFSFKKLHLMMGLLNVHVHTCYSSRNCLPWWKLHQLFQQKIPSSIYFGSWCE